MSRIRTIKPDFFKHEDLFDAEQETGLPLRVAFAGLWTQCDREGRFEWRPRQLKTDIIPYDDVDFSRVLDALVTRGFVVKYTVAGKTYGMVPSWRRHQVINNRESASSIPEPIDPKGGPDASSTRGARDSEDLKHAQGEREGERKGKEKQEGVADATGGMAFVGKIVRLKEADFDRWKSAYAGIPDFVAELTKADDFYSENPPKDGKWFFPVSRWLEKAHKDAIKKPTDPDELIYRNAL